MIWGTLALCIFFAVGEYFQHRDHYKKHPDDEPCPSAYGAFIILAVAVLVSALKGF